MPYIPPQQSARYRYATVQAVGGGLCDLDFGDGGSMAGVPVYGGSPAVGERVMVLVQGSGAVVVPPTPQPVYGHPGTAVAVTVNTGTEQVCNTLTLTAAAGSHIVYVTGSVLLGGATSGNHFEAVVRAGSATYLARARTTSAGGYLTLVSHGVTLYNHGGTMTFALLVRRETGTGTATTYADARFNTLSVLAIPVG